MAVTGQPISGTDGRVQYNGDNLNLDSFTVTPSAGDIVTTNYESGGHEEGITGVDVCEFEFSGMYDAGDPPYLAGLTVGNKTNALKLFVSRSGNKFFNFPKWRLLQAPVTSEVNNKMVR